jgi:abortive infection bacteriophage resistance protein
MAPHPETPLGITAQVTLLESHGLVVATANDRLVLGRLLADNGYSRLAPYWRHWQLDPARGNKTFLPGTTVTQIVDVYAFDATLRHILAEGLARFEIALRSRLGQEMAIAGALFTYNDPAFYIQPRHGSRTVDARQELLDSMSRELDRSKEAFITGYTRQGDTPPVWLATEAFTLSTVSKMYRLLNDQTIRHAIARGFGYPNARFAETTFHSLTVLRNICAHHARLWHRADIQYAPPVLKRLQTDPDKAVYHRTPWAWMTILADLVARIDHGSAYPDKLWAHVDSHPGHRDGLKYPTAA